MDYHSIKELIRKFWLGETSLDEEGILKEYFSFNQNPPEEFEAASEYFAYIKQESNITLDDDFDIDIMSKIESLESKNGKVIIMKKMWPMLLAACVALMVGITLINYLKDDNGEAMEKIYVEEEFIDTYDDPEKAYANVRAALMMVSSNLNEGVSYAGEIKKFDQAQKEIEKNNTP
ncbi:MAG: hypothetical protein ACI8XB_001142 [Patiriisocius sp.]|jgi:hypothetical protein